MKKIVILALVPFVFMALFSVVFVVLSVQLTTNNAIEYLESVTFEGKEVDGRVTIKVSGDTEATLKGEMSDDRKTFTAEGSTGIIDTAKAETTTENKEKCWKALKTSGCTDEAAAGIMGNIIGESNCDPSYCKDGYVGLFNLANGRGGDNRGSKMVEYCKEKNNGKWADCYWQCKYMDEKDAPETFKRYTGKTIHAFGEDLWWPEKMSWDDFKSLTDSTADKFRAHYGNDAYDKDTVGLATHIFISVFERCGTPQHLDRRYEAARQCYEEFAGKYQSSSEMDFDITATGEIHGKDLKITAMFGDIKVEADDGRFKKLKKRGADTRSKIYATGGIAGIGEDDRQFTGEIEKLNFCQINEPFASSPYTSYNTMRNTACGCFSVTHAIIVQTGIDITPIDVAKKMREKMGDSFYCDGAGTYHGVLGQVAGWYGCTYKYGCGSVKSLKDALEGGACVVAASSGMVFVNEDGSMRSSGGHYICFWKYENGHYYVKDSSRERGSKYTEAQAAALLANSGEQIVIK